jgi:hypothetical protein
MDVGSDITGFCIVDNESVAVVHASGAMSVRKMSGELVATFEVTEGAMWRSVISLSYSNGTFFCQNTNAGLFVFRKDAEGVR